MKHKERNRPLEQVNETRDRLLSKRKHQHVLVYHYGDQTVITTGLSPYAFDDVFLRILSTRPDKATLDVCITSRPLARDARISLDANPDRFTHTFGSIALQNIIEQESGVVHAYPADDHHRAIAHAALAALLSHLPTYVIVDASGRLNVLTGVVKAYVLDRYPNAARITAYAESNGAIWQRDARAGI